MQSFPRNNLRSNARKFYYAHHHEMSLVAPLGPQVAQSDLFVSTQGQGSVVLIEFKEEVEWGDANRMWATPGAFLTTCKGPAKMFDEVIFTNLRDGLINGSRWTHSHGVMKNRTFFNTTNAGNQYVANTATLPSSRIHQVAAVKRDREDAVGRDLEVHVISDGSVSPAPMRPPLPETQIVPSSLSPSPLFLF